MEKGMIHKGGCEWGHVRTWPANDLMMSSALCCPTGSTGERNILLYAPWQCSEKKKKTFNKFTRLASEGDADFILYLGWRKFRVWNDIINSWSPLTPLVIPYWKKCGLKPPKSLPNKWSLMDAHSFALLSFGEGVCLYNPHAFESTSEQVRVVFSLIRGELLCI